LENTPREIAEEPVLLTWELDSRRRWLFILASVVWVVVVILLSSALPVHHLRPPVAVGLFVLTSSLVVPLVRAGWELKCKASAVTVRDAMGLQSTLSWNEISRLRPGRYGFTVLEWKSAVGRAYLPIPPDVRDKLIAILRETSNARIIGFDSEAD